MADDSSTVPSHRNGRCQEAVDSISSLPDVILQHILSFTPTKFAMRTSLLSRRWRHVWCDLPSLSLECGGLMADSLNEILNRYTAPKLMNLFVCMRSHVPHMGRWLELAMSRNVENLSLEFWHAFSRYNIPDFFYVNSSVKQLTLKLHFNADIAPGCHVSWTSMKKLYFHSCRISDESMANILSGCPILESLTVCLCRKLTVFDLSKSLRLRAFELDRSHRVSRIVAPHIHCLRLRDFDLSSSTLVDVSSSLTEATLEIGTSTIAKTIKTDILQVMVPKMLQNLQNVEKLSFGGLFLQIISLAKLLGVPFPMLKVKSLTLETEIFQYVIPGIQTLLRNSPDLKKLTVHTTNCYTIPRWYFDKFLASQGLNPVQCWRSRDWYFWNKYCCNVESRHVASFIKLVLENTKRLEKMVIQLENDYLKFKEELLPTLCHYNNNNVSISILCSQPSRL